MKLREPNPEGQPQTDATSASTGWRNSVRQEFNGYLLGTAIAAGVSLGMGFCVFKFMAITGIGAPLAVPAGIAVGAVAFVAQEVAYTGIFLKKSLRRGHR